MPAYGLSRASMAAASPPSEFPPPPIASIHQLTPSFYLGAGSSPSVDAHQDTETSYRFDTDKKTPYQFAPSPWSDSSSGKPSHPVVSGFAGAQCNHPSSGHAQQNLPESYAYQGFGAFHGQGQGSYYGKPSYSAVSDSSGTSCNPRQNNPFNNPISGHAQQSLPESYAYQGYGASYGQGQWSYYAGPYMPSPAWPGYIVPGYIVPWLEPRTTGTSSNVQWCPLRPVSQPSDLRNVEDYQQKSEKGVSIKKLATSSEIPLENFDVKTAPSDTQDDVGLKSQDVVAGCSDFASDHQGLINKLATSSKVSLVNCDAKTAPLDKLDDVRLKSQDVPARCSGFAINYQTDQPSDGPLTNIVNPNVDTLASGAKADDKLGSGKSFNYSNHSTSTKLTGSPSSENSKLLKDKPTHLHMRSNDIKREMGRMECDLSHTSTKCSMENVSPISKDADQSANAHRLLLLSIQYLSSVLIARLTTEGETTLCRELDAIEDAICMLCECLIKQSTEGSTKKLQMQNTADKVVDTSDLDKVTETVKHCLNGGRVDNNSLSSFEAVLSSLKLRKLLKGVAINENHYLKSTIENNVMAKSLEPRLGSFSTKHINTMGLQDSKSETVVEKAGESLDLKELLKIQQELAEERAMLVKTLEKLTLEVSQMQVNVKRLMVLIQESHGQVETLGESLYDKSCKLGEAVSENKPSSRVHEWDRCSESIDAFDGSSLQYLLGETEVENKTSSLSSLFEEDSDWEHVPVCERKIG